MEEDEEFDFDVSDLPSDEELLAKHLLDEIYIEIHKEFEDFNLSGNLMNTMYIDGEFSLYIPAERYNISKFIDEGVIIYTNNGSYASEVDIHGSIYGYHKDYIYQRINNAINKWVAKNGLQVESIEWK